MKKWIPTFLTLGLTAAGAFTPQIQHYIANHPTAGLLVAGLWAVLKGVLPSPLDGSQQSSTGLKVFALFGLLCLLPVHSQAQQKSSLQNHAVPKLFRAVTYPVRHPISSGKKVLGSVLFTAESGVDVIRAVSETADKAFSTEFKPYDPLHYFAVGSAKVDDGLEHAEDVLFGFHN
jgi:hypothetical protein